jgi:hypothetical protein
MRLNGESASAFVPETDAPRIAPATQPIATVATRARDQKTWRGATRQCGQGSLMPSPISLSLTRRSLRKPGTQKTKREHNGKCHKGFKQRIVRNHSGAPTAEMGCHYER